MARSSKYPPELRERAVRMVFDHEREYPSQWKAISSISEQLGVHRESLRIWVARASTGLSRSGTRLTFRVRYLPDSRVRGYAALMRRARPPGLRIPPGRGPGRSRAARDEAQVSQLPDLGF